MQLSRTTLAAALTLTTLASLALAQSHPSPTTAPASQPTVVCAPEVQALIPAIRESERLYSSLDLGLTYRYTLHDTGPQTALIERTATSICSGGRWYAESNESTTLSNGQPSESHTITTWDGQFQRTVLHSLTNDDRVAAITLGEPSPTPHITPFAPFCIDSTRPLANNLLGGTLRGDLGTQRITRLPDTDLDNRRCVRIQIESTHPGTEDRPVRATYTWYLLADAHYLPIEMEGTAQTGKGERGSVLFQATDLKEIAAGILFPAEITQTLTDDKFGRSVTHNYDDIVYRPDLPADKLTKLPIPPGTLLIASKAGKPVAKAKTDAHWNLTSAAAFLLDPTTTTRPAK